jgi:hypothetical protein
VLGALEITATMIVVYFRTRTLQAMHIHEKLTVIRQAFAAAPQSSSAQM